MKGDYYMNEINQSRFTSYVTPDALRQYVRLSKNLFDSYTKKYCGYEDINGSYYNGTVENWGSEMLLESRKILLDKPSLKNVFIENTIDFYFDIQYSDYINTYDQQNMLCAVLRKNVLLSNKEYKLLVEDITKVRIPRSESWSDPVVYNNDYYIMTKTPPKLMIDNEPYELKLTDAESGDTVYYFSLGLNTRDLYDEIDEENNVLLTKPITDSMNGFPLIWICVDMLRLLPDINFQNNAFNRKPLLTIGTNGHDRAMIFPMMNHDSSFFNCILKVIPAVYDGFVEDETAPMNYSSKIKEIHLLVYDNWLLDPSQQPLEDYCITYDDRYAKICLNDFTGEIDLTDPIFENIEDTTHIQNTLFWHFRRPQQGEYDYSDKKYKNIVYAYAPLYAFYQNTITEGKVKLTPGFIVKFDDKYLHEYEGVMENAMTGIHIDITADKSNNGVNKKNGTVHSLGDFDGLPSYFTYMIDDTIHRSHVELYAIRDKLNDRNQKSIDKQTSAVILDSGIPQNELNLSYKDLKTCIFYDTESLTERHFSYYEENINKRNNLSEVVFVDKDTFGTSKESRYIKKQKFIYHGNRHFSLGMVGFDPDLEIGRVYVISNDKSVYENNDETPNKKDPLTFARICDIPTSFSQLISIKGTSPMFPFDKDYVRTEVSFTNFDKHMLLNLDTPRTPLRWVKPVTGSKIFGPGYFPSYCKILLNEQYPVYVNLNEKIHLNTNVEYTISSAGSDYQVDDTCSFYIGGLCIKFTVTQVDNGSVTEIKFGDELTDNPSLSYDEIVLSNFQSRITIYDAENISSNGTGLKIQCEINEDIWNSKIPHTVDRTGSGSGQPSFYFQWDKYNNIHGWIYDEDTDNFIDNGIIMGLPVVENLYDDEGDEITNTVDNVLIYNLIQPISNDFISVANAYTDGPGVIFDTVQTILPSTEDIHSMEDYSDMLNNSVINFQNTLFFINDNPSGDYYEATRCKMQVINYTQKNQEIVFNSDLYLKYYVNSTNKIRFHDRIISEEIDGHTYNFIHKEYQPLLEIYDPTMTIAYKYTDVCKDLMYVAESKYKSLKDFLPHDSNIIDEDGYMLKDLYISDEYNKSYFYNTYKESLINLSRDELIEKILTEFGSDSLPILYENTDSRYSKNRLINYILDHKYTFDNESVYFSPPIRKFKSVGQQVHDNANNPVGEQPKGRFVELSSEIFDNKTTIDGMTSTSNRMFLFKLDNVYDINDLDGFKMIDEYGFDISKSSILLINSTLYICDTSKGVLKWVPLIRNKEGEVVL